MPYKNKEDGSYKQRKKRSPENIRRNNRNWGIRKHQISLEEFSILRKMQNDLCAICNKLLVFGKRGQGNYGHAIDHNHNCILSKKHFSLKKGCPQCIRGLICPSCNIRVVPGLELIRDQGLFTHPYLLRRPILEMREG